MSYETLKKQIKEKKLARFLHFFGEERYLLNRYVNIVKNYVLDGGGDFNLIMFEGEVSAADIDISFGTPPLMGDRKLIFLKDTGVFELKNENRGLWKDVFSNAADFIYVLACEDGFDKRSPAYRAFAEKCLSVDFKRRSQGDLKAWITNLTAKAGKKMESGAAEMFIDYVGNDMYSVEQGINKLISGAGDRREITKNDVSSIITREFFTKEYLYTDALLAKNAGDAVKYLGELLEMNYEPVRLLYIVGSAFLTVYKARLMISDGEETSEIIRKLKLPSSFLAKKYIDIAKKAARSFWRMQLSL